MNVQKFKETVEKWDDFENNFRKFRIWTLNFFEQWLKEREVAWYEKEQEFEDPERFVSSGPWEDFIFDWNSTSPYLACYLCSKLGIEVEKKFEDCKIRHDYEGYFYYSDDFVELFNIVKGQEDDVKFCYGVLVLVSEASEKKAIFKKYVMEGLKECGLGECIKLMDEYNKNVFVAMWFDEKMDTARKKIKEAVIECGYSPIFIDVKEHNGQIVPEIFKEISDSEFVIADLTGQRGGVYYEAGYAEAKGKQVILSCKSDENTHFDVAQINTIYWKNEEDLYKRLINRIKSTIGEYV